MFYLPYAQICFSSIDFVQICQNFVQTGNFWSSLGNLRTPEISESDPEISGLLRIKTAKSRNCVCQNFSSMFLFQSWTWVLTPYAFHPLYAVYLQVPTLVAVLRKYILAEEPNQFTHALPVGPQVKTTHKLRPQPSSGNLLVLTRRRRPSSVLKTSTKAVFASGEVTSPIMWSLMIPHTFALRWDGSTGKSIRNSLLTSQSAPWSGLTLTN